MQKLLYLFSFLMLSVVACTKEDKDPDATPKNIAGVYRISDMEAQATGADKVNVYNQLTECQQNDTWDFDEDGTFLYGGVATNVCQSEDSEGYWSLDGKTFTIETDQNTTAYRLERFTGKNLVLSTNGTLNGGPAKYFITFTK
ncbi:MAG TPA: lipocalin family protein [Chitinophagaceae bacterium]|nr:lipocalin family protein [Chitinophagaceae bacterium]